MYDYLIVGAGLSGCVLAERLANIARKKVLLIDKREHIAGNVYDYIDECGVRVHKYGPHIFHTNSEYVFNYLSGFTGWKHYEHKVSAYANGKYVPMPINLRTVNMLFDLNLSTDELKEYFERRREKVQSIRNAEDLIVSQVGREIYELLFENYTKKQWGVNPAFLAPDVTARIPIRLNNDDRYFTDTFQYMPATGYTQMVDNMVRYSARITLELGSSFQEIRNRVSFRNLIYTGPIDEYFDYCFGKLPFRSLRIQHISMDIEQYQGIAVINYPNDFEYTRVTEYKLLTGQICKNTTLSYEFPCSEGDPFYPIPSPQSNLIFQKYRFLSSKIANVHFAGRLGSYRYYNMDQVIAQSLTLFKKLEQQNHFITHRR